MTTPSILPTGAKGDYRDYLNVKRDTSGAVRNERGAVSIPASTVTDAIIGLFPFQKGMSFAGLGGFNVHVADLDSSTNVTLDVGIVYEDNTTYTNDLDLITSASTAPQAGGFVAPDEIDFLTFVSEANGWVVAQVNAATTTTGSITFNINSVYDTVG
jgi:hypothetical protein